jgi:hypothetical protein
MTEIRPGLYRDANGYLCFYMTALLMDSGLPPTPEVAMDIRCQLIVTAAMIENKRVIEIAD